MTIAENLDRIIDAKEAIKEAIVSKGGQVVEDAKIDEYADAIEALPSGDDTLDKIFNHTVEEIHNATPIQYGRFLFANQSKLKVADVVLNDIFNTVYQYGYMFNYCTSLTTTPELPATTLANFCYTSMFQGCTSLTKAPDLPATELVNGCYQYMFYDCTSLQKTGIISATGNIGSNAGYMFQNCKSLREMTWTAKTPPTINSNMWSGCPDDMIIYVPDESVDAYKSASVWSSRASYIRPMSERPTE